MSLWMSKPMRRAVWRFLLRSRPCRVPLRCLHLHMVFPPAARAETSARASTYPIPTWSAAAKAAYRSSAPSRSERDRWATGALMHTYTHIWRRNMMIYWLWSEYVREVSYFIRSVYNTDFMKMVGLSRGGSVCLLYFACIVCGCIRWAVLEDLVHIVLFPHNPN